MDSGRDMNVKIVWSVHWVSVYQIASNITTYIPSVTAPQNFTYYSVRIHEIAHILETFPRFHARVLYYIHCRTRLQAHKNM